MPAWMEKIKKTLSSKTDLKSLFIELQPDNRINSFAEVSYIPFDTVSYPSFLNLTARIALDKDFIPDNLLLRFEGIPAKDIPSMDTMSGKESAEALRFIASHGGITDENTVPLRKAVYLEAHKMEVSKENLQELDHSPCYQHFAAHEVAMERIAAGKPAKLFFTITETPRGAKVFGDGLSGGREFQNYLQTLADHFFSQSLQGMETLRIYRIESGSRKLLELSQDAQKTIPLSHAGMDILKNYLPSVTFDMRPKGENLDRFITANSLELSTHNRNVMTLQDIADRGYTHLSADESFAYRKEFAPIEKGIREITRQRDAERNYPFEKKMEELQTAARLLAQTLLNMENIRKEHRPVPPVVTVPDVSNGVNEEPVRSSAAEKRKKMSSPKKKQPGGAVKAVSRKKQAKPKL